MKIAHKFFQKGFTKNGRREKRHRKYERIFVVKLIVIIFIYRDMVTGFLHFNRAFIENFVLHGW